MSGVFIKFTIPKNGKTSAANVRYITRETATNASDRNIQFHNLENLRGQNYRETRTNFISYAEARLDEESVKVQRGAGNARTHYRVVLSFDRNESTNTAQELSQKWLKENFPDCRAASVVHQDTQHTHAHVWIEATKLNDKKLQLDNKKYRQLDESWAKIYAEKYGERYLTDHLAKKERTKIYKREYVKAKLEGRFIEKPKDKPTVDYKKREANNYDQSAAGVHQRNPTNETKILSESKRELSNSIDGSERTKKEIDERVRNSQQGKSQVNKFELARSESIERVNKLYGAVAELGKNLESERAREEEKSNVRVYERERERVRERTT
jgi:hypothetical protein